MTFEDYKQLISKVSLGKRLPDAIYLHKSFLNDALPRDLLDLIGSQIKHHRLEHHDCNVVKLSRVSFSFSLLYYLNFYEDPYPELKVSYKIDVLNNQCKVYDYSQSDNPPILHRKETLIKRDDPAYESFCKITKEAEAIGLYANPKNIGFKKQWLALIQSKGFTLQDGKLIKISNL